MRDYMKALYLRFESPPEKRKMLEQNADRLHKQLSSRLAKPERKLLLQLVDLEGELRFHGSLDSFMSGFRLASGIYRELAEQPPYSFNDEEEQRVGKVSIPSAMTTGGDPHGKETRQR